MTLRSDWVPQTAPPVDINKGGSSGGSSIGTTTTPNVSTVKDATTADQQNVLTPQADGVANTKNGAVTSSLNYVYNPTNGTWDRARGNATQGTLVYGNLSVAQVANTAVATTNPSATTTDSTVLAANANRKRVLIYNTSTTATVRLRYGSAATATAFQWIIPPSSNGASYLQIPAEFILPSDLHATTDAGTAALVISEFS